jgi:hypothetical protein
VKLAMSSRFWRVVLVGILAALLGGTRLRTRVAGLATAVGAAAKTAVLLL